MVQWCPKYSMKACSSYGSIWSGPTVAKSCSFSRVLRKIVINGGFDLDSFFERTFQGHFESMWIDIHSVVTCALILFSIQPALRGIYHHGWPRKSHVIKAVTNSTARDYDYKNDFPLHEIIDALLPICLYEYVGNMFKTVVSCHAVLLTGKRESIDEFIQGSRARNTETLHIKATIWSGDSRKFIQGSNLDQICDTVHDLQSDLSSESGKKTFLKKPASRNDVLENLWLTISRPGAYSCLFLQWSRGFYFSCSAIYSFSMHSFDSGQARCSGFIQFCEKLVDEIA